MKAVDIPKYTDNFPEELKLLLSIANSQSCCVYLLEIVKAGDISSCRNLLINEERLKYLNRTQHEITDMGFGLFSHYIHPDDLKILPDTLKNLSKQNPDPYIEVLYRVKDEHSDQYKWYISHVCKQKYFMDGTPREVMVVALEISSNRQNLINLVNSLKPHCYPEQKALFDTLSRREKQVLKLIVEGYSDTEIADKLFVSKTTVHTHRRNIMRKTDQKNSILLVVQAIKCGEY